MSEPKLTARVHPLCKDVVRIYCGDKEIGDCIHSFDIAAEVERRINAHEALVRAMESMLHRFGHLTSGLDPGKQEAVAEAEAALDAAKGESNA